MWKAKPAGRGRCVPRKRPPDKLDSVTVDKANEMELILIQPLHSLSWFDFQRWEASLSIFISTRASFCENFIATAASWRSASMWSDARTYQLCFRKPIRGELVALPVQHSLHNDRPWVKGLRRVLTFLGAASEEARREFNRKQSKVNRRFQFASRFADIECIAAFFGRFSALPARKFRAAMQIASKERRTNMLPREYSWRRLNRCMLRVMRCD